MSFLFFFFLSWRTWNLTYVLAFVYKAYYLARYSHTSHKSLLNLMVSEVLPTLIDRPDRPFDSITILNSGSIRFDVFKGPFTRNDQVRRLLDISEN